MSSAFEITGSAQLQGEVAVYGSKNAALPLLAASLLTSDEVTLNAIPDIRDVATLRTILESIGSTIEQEGTTFRLRTESITGAELSNDLVGQLRGSILLLGALLGRNRAAKLSTPGGDIIGARPIDAHIDAFKQLGVTGEVNDGVVELDAHSAKAGRVIMSEFSVTATENVMMLAATLPGRSTIELAAAEPHIVILAELLTKMGAHIEGAGTHTIHITGSEPLRGAEVTNIPDMLEAGFFILLAAATQSSLAITNVPTDHLTAFFKKLDDIGIAYSLVDETRVEVQPSTLESFHIQALPYPGLATDLQAPFAVIATQASGSSLIHDPLYEGRFKHIHELQKMGADAIVCDPHRVIINGPTKLIGRRIPSLDIRSGATLIMAGLIAEGTTTIDNAEIIDRGYADLVGRLAAVGASIRRVELA